MVDEKTVIVRDGGILPYYWKAVRAGDILTDMETALLLINEENRRRIFLW